MGRFGSLRASFTSSVEAVHNILHLAATASPSLAAVSRKKRNSSGNRSKTSFSPITQVKEYCHSGGDSNSSEEEGLHTTAAPQLHWNEARRTCSEPTAELHRCGSQLSICSLSSHSGDDDVFLAEPGTSGTTATTTCEPAAAAVCGSSFEEEQEEGENSSEEWWIPSSEVALNYIISSTDRETIYSGYWHGNVQVHTRHLSSSCSMSCFLDEVSTLSCVRHENIQLFMGACCDHSGQSLALIMSELKGDTLFARLHKYGHEFTGPSKAMILKQIIEGLTYLHDKDITHGMLSSHCITLHHRVCISLWPLTCSHQLLPSSQLPYLPPESIRALCCNNRGRLLCRERASYVGDVFAFGTLVYELLTLETPLSSLSVEELIWAVGQGHTQSLSRLPKSRFCRLISQCWRNNPELRPSFNELLAAIEQDATLACGMYSRRHLSHSLPCISTETTSVCFADLSKPTTTATPPGL